MTRNRGSHVRWCRYMIRESDGICCQHIRSFACRVQECKTHISALRSTACTLLNVKIERARQLMDRMLDVTMCYLTLLLNVDANRCHNCSLHFPMVREIYLALIEQFMEAGNHLFREHISQGVQVDPAFRGAYEGVYDELRANNLVNGLVYRLLNRDIPIAPLPQMCHGCGWV